MNTTKCVLAFTLPLSISGSASALTIDFEELAQNNATQNDISAPYFSQGFEFQSEAPFHVWGTQSSFYAGSTALWAGGSDTIRLTQTNNAVFTMNSIQLAGVSLSGVQDIVFTGTRPDNSTDQETFHLSNPGVLQTFNFANMTGVVSVQWGQAVPYHQFDNVNLTPTPEPASLCALGLGLVGILRRRRR